MSATTQLIKRRQDRVITFLTQDEVRRLFSVIKNTRDRAIFAVAYRHGLRASEVGLLQRTDVDLKAARITINRLKGSLAGVYPMAPETEIDGLAKTVKAGRRRPLIWSS